MPSPTRIAKYVRFEHAAKIHYGIWEQDKVKALERGLFDAPVLTGREYALSEIKLLVPCVPSKVLAVGLNYASHRVHVEAAEGVFVNVAGRPVSSHDPVVFAKFPTSLIPHNQDIVLPADATNVHFEGELVLIVGKRAKRVPVEQASRYVFGVTIGNDLVDREWLLGDLQWFRAKGSDDFGPIGPA